ncbi:sushi, von Willebrand factor type A, EGF and pentraxin domain-containing protein 1-like isoform X2 [Leptopilina boulardi]|uniref:sushi, von Willebrand factor type A, EGF and pentraxin domain-containing protein 1-like isoform X2 n=1 Tax=Leptopilina boulardi TaxID=63433 RepID=UPI0021F5E91F|nr:sushi, von Willebrand factor type A, EGF and pentraxin domain-containing protein 1-like isoform X2 [Leptopilina boulardi]
MAFSSVFTLFIIAIVQQNLAQTIINNENNCQSLSVQNGNVRNIQINGIQKFSFNCGNGFIPVGKTISTCYNGQWSNPNPSCATNYGLIDIDNGVKKFFKNGHTLICYYVCNEGYQISGKNQMIFLSNRWFGTSPSCIPKQNINETEAINVNINLENGIITKSGEFYVADCNSEYILIGAKVFSTYTPDVVKCIKSEIQHNVNLDNGIINASDNGRKYTFQCNDGFKLHGEQEIRFINNQWTAPVPLCLPIKTIPNGKGIMNIDGTITFTCNFGFILYGNPIAQNLPNAAVPFCISTNDLVLENGKVDVTIVSTGYQLVYKCNDMYQLVGDEKNMILTKQEIINKPQCVPKNKTPDTQVIDIKIPNGIHLNNGIFQISDNGYTYTFQCNDGFKLHGEQQIRFINNKWTAAVPLCLPENKTPNTHVVVINIATGIHLNNGIFQISDNGYTYTFQCNDGFKLHGEQQIRFINNQWTAPVPLCLPANPSTQDIDVNQKAIKTIPNGKGVMNIDGTITFTCNFGFTLYGNPIAQNLPNAAVPICVPTNDLVLENGHVGVKIVSTGYELVYKCNDMFQLVDKQKGFLLNGEPIPYIPQCVPVCQTLFIKNGWVESNNQSNIAHFGCCDGFQLQGSTESTCVNGHWINPIPVCIPLCKEITLMNGKATFNKESTTFSCNPGFYLLGAEETVCNNGQWMADTPVCIPNCPALQIENGFYQIDENKQIFQFGCNAGFELIGSSEISCSYGQWSKPAPVCVAACQPLHINNGVAKMNKDFTVVRVQCNSGYVLIGSQEIKCNAGQWNTSVPTCTPLCEAVQTYGIQVEKKDLLKYNCQIH